jgi:hypothetical protein
MPGPDVPLTESDFKVLALTTQLERGLVYVTLDARQDGVLVPPELKARSGLTLVLGKDLPVPIPDLEVGQLALTATLSFNQQPFRCVIPWEAIYAFSVDGVNGVLFKQSVPKDVSIISAPERPKLGVLDGGKTDKAQDAPKNPKRTTLKLV